MNDEEAHKKIIRANKRGLWFGLAVAFVLALYVLYR